MADDTTSDAHAVTGQVRYQAYRRLPVDGTYRYVRSNRPVTRRELRAARLAG